MVIYLIALLLTCIFSFFTFIYKKEKPVITHKKVFFVFLPLLLVSLFKWNVGNDVIYGSGFYYRAYSFVHEGFANVYNYEFGFYFLMEIGNFFHINFYFFTCIITFLFFYLFTKYISQNSKNIILVAIIFVMSDLYLFTFATLRQTMAIALSLYPLQQLLSGEKVLKDKKWWIFLVLSLSMHNSILYLYIILLISKIRFKKIPLILVTLTTCAISILFQDKLIGLLAYNSYFQKYIGSNYFISDFSITYFGIALVMFIISLIYYKKLNNNSDYRILNFCAITTLLMANSKILVMPYRVFPMFIPVYIIVCSKVISRIKKDSDAPLITTLLVLIPYILLFINQYYLQGAKDNFKYHSIFEFPDQVWNINNDVMR